MSYDICSICGRFYAKDGQSYCGECRDKDKKEFNKLRTLVKQRPGILAFEASNQTGIPINTIMRYVKERRIYIAGDGKDSGKIYFRDTLPEDSRKRRWTND
ncbi:hypothetical protein [Desulfuribacillus alkaliarsenatis]|uniref:Flagellar protein n=1 Tax=Desulfuribacillus alkaliarsenatis TaxID=766136 RepID=A0A1E5G3S9_9FIRM|nr:hypothetical protein [Desulfuribacillus alkaliarsenatis]OEF97732.1 hypothetical protein BHF68_14135 [Desulfuribacillus alkaliarsenatis]